MQMQSNDYIKAVLQQKGHFGYPKRIGQTLQKKMFGVILFTDDLVFANDKGLYGIRTISCGCGSKYTHVSWEDLQEQEKSLVSEQYKEVSFSTLSKQIGIDI